MFDEKQNLYTEADVVVVGGGAAGITAALVLARARRSVVLIDDGTYRNRSVLAFHGFPGRDGSSPERFRAEASRELDSYGVIRLWGSVASTEDRHHGVIVRLADGEVVTAAAIVLATGVHDELPSIDGLAHRWGKSVFSCPFCDGWEHRDRPVAVIAAAPGAEELAEVVRSWTPLVTLVESRDVARLVGVGTTMNAVELIDGRVVAASAAFVRAPIRPRNAAAVMLGCAIDQQGYVITDEQGATLHHRVWAAGDLRRPPPLPHQVVLAAADGSTAAIAVHRALLQRAAEHERRAVPCGS